MTDMEKLQQDAYYKGYMAGYRDGIREAADGKPGTAMPGDILDHPVEELGLSTRAYHCLTRAGCAKLSDIAALDAYTVASMRTMGAKTASEIARCLVAHGIPSGVWLAYL